MPRAAPHEAPPPPPRRGPGWKRRPARHPRCPFHAGPRRGGSAVFFLLQLIYGFIYEDSGNGASPKSCCSISGRAEGAGWCSRELTGTARGAAPSFRPLLPFAFKKKDLQAQAKFMQKRGRNPVKAEQRRTGKTSFHGKGQGWSLLPVRVQEPLLKKVPLSSALPFTKLLQKPEAVYACIYSSFVPIPFPDVADVVQNLFSNCEEGFKREKVLGGAPLPIQTEEMLGVSLQKGSELPGTGQQLLCWLPAPLAWAWARTRRYKASYST